MVTIFFSDIMGYTKMSSEMTPIEVMNMLNELYSKFDALSKKHKVFKVETIGGEFLLTAFYFELFIANSQTDDIFFDTIVHY